MQVRYLNPVTDFGFKKLFGEEADKPLLMDFLNALLPLEHPITELSFRNAKQLGDGVDEGKAIYDIPRLRSVKDCRSFYTTFPIREQAEKRFWNFDNLGSHYS